MISLAEPTWWSAPASFAPVLGMVAGVAAVALNHERLKLRIAALEQRIAQAEWLDGINRGDAAYPCRAPPASTLVP
jgi:hypothetical protein